MRFATDAARREYAEWLDGLGAWRIALTLTFTKVKATGDHRSVSDVVQTTRHLIRLINRACFGHGAVRKGYCVASLYVVEYGYGGRHPHVHASISLPPDYDYRLMCRLIHEKARKLHSIDQQIHLQKYADFGWIDYFLKTGTDNLVLEDIRQAKP
jgi:hypothetical protein